MCPGRFATEAPFSPHHHPPEQQAEAGRKVPPPGGPAYRRGPLILHGAVHVSGSSVSASGAGGVRVVVARCRRPRAAPRAGPGAALLSVPDGVAAGRVGASVPGYRPGIASAWGLTSAAVHTTEAGLVGCHRNTRIVRVSRTRAGSRGIKDETLIALKHEELDHGLSIPAEATTKACA